AWEDLADEVLLRPLGMASTSYRFADYEARPDRAVGHIHVDGRYEPLYVRDADPEAPAGGARSTVHDMTRWLTMAPPNRRHHRQPGVEAGRRLEGAAAGGDAADRVESRVRTRDAVRLLRLRVQRRVDVGGADGAQPFRGVRTRRRHELRDSPFG